VSQEEELEKAQNSDKDFRIWTVKTINKLTADVATLKSDARWTKWLLAILLILIAALYGIDRIIPIPS